MNQEYVDFLASKTIRARERGLAHIPELASHLFPFQRLCIENHLRVGAGGCFLDTGLGKAQPADELILTPSGPCAIGDLAIGHYVVGRDGQPTAVTAIFPQGKRRAYRVTFTDGATTRCDIEHLWAVRSKVQRYRNQPFRVCTLRQILDEGLVSQEGWRHFVPMPDPIDFDGEPLPVDPYLLGALIGDGYIAKGGPRISSADAEILEAVAGALPDGLQLRPYGGYDWGITTGRRNGSTPNPNVLHYALRVLGLTGKRAETKFIPSIYKYASIQDRIRLLQGLLDTDGHVRPTDNNVEFSTASPTLAQDVGFLVRSLGGRAKIHQKPTQRQIAYRMSICLPDAITPFSLSRKASVYRPRPKYKPTRAICSVQECGETEMVCIRVAAADSLYVTAECIVTHNTEVQLEWCHQLIRATNKKALIWTPLAVAGQTKRRAEKWGYEARVIREQSEAGPGINICNYDRRDKLDPAEFEIVSCDEASIMKSFTGKTTQAMIEAFRGHRFKLVATATPAPNDHMELGNYAEFLDVMSANEMLSRFFINDTSTASQQWRLKGHAVGSFWDWMSSWARMGEKPSDITGNLQDDNGFELLPFEVIRHRSRDSSIDQTFADMFGGTKMSATAIHDVKRQTSEARAGTISKVITPNDPWLIWCDTNDEADRLKSAIPEAIEVRGSMSIEQKEELLDAFGKGDERILISKPSICGFGLDWSHCAHMAFVGRSYSYETWYQAIRRCWRFGQKRNVKIHLAVAEGETEIGRVIDRKAGDHVSMKAAMREAMKRAIGQASINKVAYNPTKTTRLAPWISAA